MSDRSIRPILLIQGATRARARTITITGATLTDNGGGDVDLAISGGGGGGGLWTSSGYTGTADRIAGFNGAGAAGLVTLTSPLSLSGGALSVDLSAYLTTAAAAATYLTITNAAATYLTIAGAAAGYQPLDADLTALAGLGNGLPYRSGGSWGAYGLGDLAINAGNIEVATVGGSSAATVAGQRTAHEAAYDHGNIPTADEKDALTGSSGTPDSTNPYVTSADPRLTGASGGAAVAAAAEYGTGVHGTLDLDGTNTYAGIVTLSGSTYTVDAGVVLNANNLTVDAGITLKSAGSPVRVLTLLALDGAIDCTGSASTGQPAGVGAGPALVAALPATGNVFAGGDPGTAGTTSNATGGAAALIASTICCGGQSGAGGSGVYATTTRAGGSGTLASSAVQADHYHGEMQSLLQIGRADAGTSRLYLCGGAGGAAGGNSVGSGSGTLHSGGGGGGGGIAAVFARTASFGASAVITADGGTGGSATYTTPGGNAGSGGGGGGGGGVVFLKVGDVTGTQQLPALYARGGAGGNANNVGAGYGNGGNGGNGGKIYCIVANYTGSAPTTANTGGAGGTGAGGSGASGATGSSGPTPVYISL
jgi:hypothetical protein